MKLTSNLYTLGDDYNNDKESFESILWFTLVQYDDL